MGATAFSNMSLVTSIRFDQTYVNFSRFSLHFGSQQPHQKNGSVNLMISKLFLILSSFFGAYRVLPDTEVHPPSSVTLRHTVGAAGIGSLTLPGVRNVVRQRGRRRKAIPRVQDQETRGANRGRTKVQSLFLHLSQANVETRGRRKWSLSDSPSCLSMPR